MENAQTEAPQLEISDVLVTQTDTLEIDKKPTGGWLCYISAKSPTERNWILAYPVNAKSPQHQKMHPSPLFEDRKEAIRIGTALLNGGGIIKLFKITL